MRPRSPFPRPLLVLVSVLMLIAGPGIALAQKAGEPKYENEIRIEKIPEQTVVFQTVFGNYDSHPEIFSTMMGMLEKHQESSEIRALAADSGCVGIYAMDPDVVNPADFQWSAAIPVPTSFKLSEEASKLSLSQLRVRVTPYQVVTLPAVTAAVLDSTVADSPRDGLRLYPWMNENGFAQAGPTRMVFFNDENLDVTRASIGQMLGGRTRIILPIRKREYFGEISLGDDAKLQKKSEAPVRADAVRLQEERERQAPPP